MAAMGKNALKTYNKAKILKLLLDNENIYRAEIARQMNLSIPTVMKITEEFAQKGLVSNVGKGVSSGGKPPELLKIIPNACFFIGVGLSGSYFKCIIINLKGKVIHRHSVQHIEWKNAGRANGAQTMACLIDLIRTTVDNVGIDKACIVGIGIEVPHPVDVDKGIVLSAKELGWEKFDLITPLWEEFHLPVIIENTPRVLAMGERWLGNGANFPSFMLIIVGRGIGSAIFIEDDLYRGVNKMSGEIGHTVIQLDGPECICGNHGCLESLASGRAIIREVKRQMDKGRQSMLARMVSTSTPLAIELICDAAEAGDSLAKEVLDDAAAFLSVGIVNAVNMFDVDLVLLTGEMINRQEGIVERIGAMANKSRQKYYGKDNLLVSELKLGKDATVIGAATLQLKAFVDHGGSMPDRPRQ